MPTGGAASGLDAAAAAFVVSCQALWSLNEVELFSQRCLLV